MLLLFFVWCPGKTCETMGITSFLCFCHIYVYMMEKGDRIKIFFLKRVRFLRSCKKTAHNSLILPWLHCIVAAQEKIMLKKVCYADKMRKEWR